jgi:hypothetical protein
MGHEPLTAGLAETLVRTVIDGVRAPQSGPGAGRSTT